MSEWKKVKLGECITTKKGFAFKSALYTPKGVPVVRVSDFTLNSITDKDLVYYPVSEYNNYKDYVLTEKDILVQTVGSWQYNPNSVVGKVVRVPYYHQGSLLNQNIVKIIPIECIDKDYLYYRIKCVDFSGYVIGEARGAANQASITLDTIKRFAFLLPPKDVQERIGATLSRYDSLIENYQKQIKLLEEAAQRLYKEWFVDLHFPGHENTKIVNGVPEGWEKKSIADLGTYLNGFAFKPSDWQERGKPIIKIKEMGNGISTDTPRNNGERVPEKYLIKSGDLLFSWSATLMVIVWTGEEGWLNQHLFKVTPTQGIGREFLLQSISKTIAEFSNLTTGSTMKHIQRNKLEQVFVNTPTSEIMNCYCRIAERQREQILNISSQIHHLTEARDRLLPKLMSEEIKV